MDKMFIQFKALSSIPSMKFDFRKTTLRVKRDAPFRIRLPQKCHSAEVYVSRIVYPYKKIRSNRRLPSPFIPYGGRAISKGPYEESPIIIPRSKAYGRVVATPEHGYVWHLSRKNKGFKHFDICFVATEVTCAKSGGKHSKSCLWQLNIKVDGMEDYGFPVMVAGKLIRKDQKSAVCQPTPEEKPMRKLTWPPTDPAIASAIGVGLLDTRARQRMPSSSSNWDSGSSKPMTDDQGACEEKDKDRQPDPEPLRPARTTTTPPCAPPGSPVETPAPSQENAMVYSSLEAVMAEGQFNLGGDSNSELPRPPFDISLKFIQDHLEVAWLTMTDWDKATVQHLVMTLYNGFGSAAFPQ